MVGRVAAPLGPLDATLTTRPLGGPSTLEVPPLRSLAVDLYDGPLRLDVQLRQVDAVQLQELTAGSAGLDGVVDQVSVDLQSALVKLAVVTGLGAVGGASLAALLVFRRRREPLIAGGLAVLLLAGTAGLGAATWRPEALAQPAYTGLLSHAGSLIGSAEDILADFDAYRASLEDLVANVSALYGTLSTLEAPSPGEDAVALLHISDLHLNPLGLDLVEQVVDAFAVDGVLDTGDITDWGSTPEAAWIRSVGRLPVPYVYIRGNHDSAAVAEQIAALPDATVLDDSAVSVAGIDIVGTPDPRFTPDKSATGDPPSLEETGEELADVARSLPEPPDIALVHDPKQAPPLDGVAPLVLAGHTHDREVSVLDDGTRLMVQGSTGGAGLRALQGEYPAPLACTVLYLDPDTGALVGYDEITLGGLGESQVLVQRTVVEQPDGDRTSPSD